MGRLAKVKTSDDVKSAEWDPVCPRCNRSRPVGKLCGGTHPKFYCRDCAVEFSVKKLRGVPVSAKVQISTCSGIRVMQEHYRFDAKENRFVITKKSGGEVAEEEM